MTLGSEPKEIARFFHLKIRRGGKIVDSIVADLPSPSNYVCLLSPLLLPSAAAVAFLPA